jgi:OPA family glycerol-3-phosphate transporter-like MFS transporter
MPEDKDAAAPLTKPIHDFKYKLWRFRIFFITWLAYGGFYLTRKCFSVAKIEIAKDADLLISKTDMGWIDNYYLCVYALGQFVCGVCGDRFGTRKIVLTGMFISVIAAVAMGLSNTVILLGVFFCLQGLCQSSGWAPLVKNVGNWFSLGEHGRIMGWWCTNYAVGGLVATAIAAFAAQSLGHWRFAFFVPAALLFGVWILFFILQRNRPKDVGLPPIEEYRGDTKTMLLHPQTGEDAQQGNWQTVRSVLKEPMVRVMSAVYFFLKPTRYAILFWGPMFVHEQLGTGIMKSAGISLCFELGGPLGTLFGGYVSDVVCKGKRMPVSVLSLLALAVVLFFFNRLAALESAWVLAGLFFVIGFLLYIPDSLVSGTAAIDFGTKEGASTAAGVINGFGSMGAILGGGYLPGKIAETWGWNPLFTVLAVSVLLAGLILLPKWNALPATSDQSP